MLKTTPKNTAAKRSPGGRRGSSESVRGPCEGHRRERPRYFARQLITPEELNLEQAYFRDRMRRHNRLLHGWGVVCGAEVCPVPIPEDTDGGERRREYEAAQPASRSSREYSDASHAHSESAGPRSGSNDAGSRAQTDPCDPCDGWEPWKVVVTPGFILGPYGDEIMISSRVVVDLRERCVPGVSDDCWTRTPDPWCSEVKLHGLESPVYLAVHYKETMTRPVRVPRGGCGCEDLECEYSRWCDGYELCVLTECPESHRGTPVLEPEFLPACPPCPQEPWVVLAEIEFDPRTGCVQRIDNCSCRRLVRSHACYWWSCADEAKEREAPEYERRAEERRYEAPAPPPAPEPAAEPAMREAEAREEEMRHVGGGWFEVAGFEGRVRSRENARIVIRALAEGRDPFELVDADSITR
jgi:hypothetical protein